MSDDYKKRIEKALNKFAERDNRELQKLNGTIKKRKNAKPEKDVEKECLTWMRGRGWNVQIYESKATQVNGVWRQQAMQAGNADCQGIMPGGVSVAVEFKAPGKLATFNRPQNQRQIDFIEDRITMGGFACVVDSVSLLQHIYETWLDKKLISDEEAISYLLEVLP
ncbi:MAG: hypothetical protein ACK58T_22650 [Phycisphaerae bacterium]|jgi:hypothetical protein